MTNRKHESLDAQYGKTIKRVRSLTAMPQGELVQKLSEQGLTWSQGTLSKVEMGDRPIRLSEAEGVAAALGISLEELIGRDSPEMDFAREARRQELDAVEQFIQTRRAL